MKYAVEAELGVTFNGNVPRVLTKRTLLRREARRLRKKTKRKMPYQWASCEYSYGDMRR